MINFSSQDFHLGLLLTVSHSAFGKGQEHSHAGLYFDHSNFNQF